MGKSAPKAPPAPDPAATAKAQGAANLETAIGQGWLSALNQYGPQGSVTYDQIGTETVGDKEVPRFAQTTTLSPEQQAQYDLTNQLQMKALGLGQDVLGNVEDTVSQPFPTADSFTEGRDAVVQGLLDRNRPEMERQRAALETQLANQGITPGSEAFQRRMDDLGRQENDFRLAALNSGGAEQNRLFSLAQAARSQPINEYATLLGLGGQVQTPQSQGYAAPQLQGTDIVGPTNLAYQGQLAGWNANNAANQSAMSNLFGLGGSLGGAWIMKSDIRLKTDIKYAGRENGFPVYTFRYKSKPDEVYRGVMAQEVMQTHPEAIVMDGDYMAVDYSKIGVEFGRVH